MLTIRLWTLVAGVALVAGGWWLRTPSVGYLAFTIAATVATLGIALLLRPRRAPVGRRVRRCARQRSRSSPSSSQRDLTRIDTQLARLSRARGRAAGGAEFQQRDRAVAVELQTQGASRARRAAQMRAQAFAVVRTHDGGCAGAGDRRSTIAALPFAWGGRLVVPPDSARSARRRAAHALLYGALRGGDARHAARGRDRGGVRGAAGGSARAGDRQSHRARAGAARVRRDGARRWRDRGRIRRVCAERTDTLLVAHAVAPGEEEARLTTLVRVRLTGAIFLAIAFAFFLVAAVAAPAIAARPAACRSPSRSALLALVPLNAFSGSGVLFDPDGLLRGGRRTVHRVARRARRDRDDRAAGASAHAAPRAALRRAVDRGADRARDSRGVAAAAARARRRRLAAAERCGGGAVARLGDRALSRRRDALHRARGGRQRGARRAARAPAVGRAGARDARRGDRAVGAAARRARGPRGIA